MDLPSIAQAKDQGLEDWRDGAPGRVVGGCWLGWGWNLDVRKGHLIGGMHIVMRP